MKYLLLICVSVLSVSASYAQNGCSLNHPIFRFKNTDHPKVIRTLGSSPEFTFLQNLSSATQVLEAMEKAEKRNDKAARELNSMLMSIGFTNGISDVKLSSIIPVTVPSGTKGNLGDGNCNAEYSVLVNSKGFKAWRITSPVGCYMYFMSRCGNAFAINDQRFRKGGAVSSLTVPVSISADPKVITTDSAAKRIAENKYYIYYHKRGKKGMDSTGSIPDASPSDPLLLRSVQKAEFVPQQYTVTASAQNDRVTVWRGKPLNVPANINVDHPAVDNYPNTLTNTYKEVSKRVYRKSKRKMRKADRKETKVTHMTDVRVNR